MNEVAVPIWFAWTMVSINSLSVAVCCINTKNPIGAVLGTMVVCGWVYWMFK